MRVHDVRLAITLVGVLLLAVAPGPAQAAEVNINFFLGGKTLDRDDWGDADKQGAFGVQTTVTPENWPVSLAFDLYGSGSTQNIYVSNPVPATLDLYESTGEFDVGVRKIWKSGKTRPFVGGGLAFLNAHTERNSGLVIVSDADVSPGLWLGGGVFWRLGKKINLGFEARFSGGQVQLFGDDIQAGGLYFGALVGWGWGGGAN